MLILFFAMLFCHIVDDYYLQGILASMKQKVWWQKNAPQKLYKSDWLIALIEHSFSWAFMTSLPLIIYYYINSINMLPIIIAMLVNTAIHAIVDNEKANKFTINLCIDQSIHIFQLIITWALLAQKINIKLKEPLPQMILSSVISIVITNSREQDIMIEEALELLKKTQLKSLWDQKGINKMSWIYENIEFIAGLLIGLCAAILVYFGASLYMWKHDHTDMYLVEEVDENENVYECKCCGARTLHNETITFPRYCAFCGREVEYICNKDERKWVTWNS